MLKTILPLILFLTSSLFAADPPSLSEQYPDDASIDKDRSVLFADNFESADLKKWQDHKGPVSLTQNNPNGGKSCVVIPMTRGKDTGGHLVHWFMPGADTVHARFYVKFSDNYTYVHHFVALLANQRDNRWSAFGKAGKKPDGTHYSTFMEPNFAWGKNPPPGELNFYSYFLDMKIDPKMNMYWGNAFYPPGPAAGAAASQHRVIPSLGKWQCWEFMLQANTAPDKADGKQTMWLDGKLVGQFTGIRWRSDMDLKVNALWLEHYGYDSGDPTKQYWKDSQTVWFDDVVVATRYIGPKKEK